MSLLPLLSLTLGFLNTTSLPLKFQCVVPDTDTVVVRFHSNLEFWNTLVDMGFLMDRMGAVIRVQHLQKLYRESDPTIHLVVDNALDYFSVSWGGMSLAMGQRYLGTLQVPRDVLGLLAYGNAFDSTYTFDQTKAVSLLYRYLAVGVTQQVHLGSRPLRAGFGVSMLIGNRLDLVDTVRGYLYTDQEGLTAEVDLRTATSKTGYGLALSGGAELQVTPRLRIGASVGDFPGVMRWRDFRVVHQIFRADSAYINQTRREELEDYQTQQNLFLPVQTCAYADLTGPWWGARLDFRQLLFSSLPKVNNWAVGGEVRVQPMHHLWFTLRGIWAGIQGAGFILRVDRRIGPLNFLLSLGTEAGLPLKNKGLIAGFALTYHHRLL